VEAVDGNPAGRVLVGPGLDLRPCPTQPVRAVTVAIARMRAAAVLRINNRQRVAHKTANPAEGASYIHGVMVTTQGVILHYFVIFHTQRV
jgi:hypothetical protein